MSTQYNGKAANIVIPSPVNITGSTNSNPISIGTSGPSGLTSGDTVTITGHLLNTTANGTWTATVTGANTFTIPVAGIATGGSSGHVQSLALGATFAQPSDGDAAVAASVNTALDTLADRIAYVYVNTGAAVANYLQKAGDAFEGTFSFGSIAQMTANIGGAIVSTVAQGIQSFAPDGITSTVIGGISSGVAGGIQCNGSSTDEIDYGIAHSVTRRQPLVAAGVVVSGWLTTYTGWGGPGTATSQYFLLDKLVNGSLSGAKLTAVEMRILPNAHTGLPATFPTIDILRISNANGVTQSVVSLFSSAPQSVPSQTLGAWNSGVIQVYTFTPNQNNTIDTTNYIYVAVITDEGGGSAVSGNNYYELTLVETGIQNGNL